MNTPQDSALGQPTTWPSRLDPGLLFPIPRQAGRAALGLEPGQPLPFHGTDLWNAWELSWLEPGGKPAIAVARIDVPADSPNLIESKSLKLYLGSFATMRMADPDAVRGQLVGDLSAAAGAPVGVELLAPGEPGVSAIRSLPGECIDDLPIEIDRWGPPAASLLACAADDIVQESLVSHLFRSNCPVTHQPDWASVQVRYHGPRLDRAGLLRYLVSFREHSGFHEQCVEQIFVDLSKRCAPRALTVYARFTRRGGIDINPWRSSTPGEPENLRQARQ